MLVHVVRFVGNELAVIGRVRLPPNMQSKIHYVYVPVYDVQSVVSTLIGDTRIVKRPPFIGHAQVKAMQAVKHALDPNGILNPGKIFN